MQLSNSTLTVLRNFASINPNLYVEKGTSLIKTVSEAKNIMATAQVLETFQGSPPGGASLGIYDLNEFLAAVNLLDNPDIEWDSTKITMRDSTRNKTLTYFCAAPEILTYPPKEIKNPEYEIELEISQEVMTDLKKAASVFGFNTFQIVSESGSEDVLCRVCDVQNQSPNTYSEKVGTVEPSNTFNFDFVISNLKCIPDDYDVQLSSKFISCWKSKSNTKHSNVTYWVAMEKTSNKS